MSLILAIAIGLGGCITVNPPAAAPTVESPPTEIATAPEAASTITTAAILVGPEVPQEVLSLWKSQPTSPASPPDIQDEITLEPNTASGSIKVSENISLSILPPRQDSTDFYLKEGQWIDVIVSSLNIPVYFNWEEPGAISLTAERAILDEYGNRDKRGNEGFPQMAQKVGEPPIRDTGVFGPFQGKPLYENLVTNTEKGTIFTTAARIFAWNGAGEYWFVFYNWNRQEEADITCRVYKLGATPGWGKSFWDAKMQPWLNDLYYMQVAGKISQEEYNQAEAKWLEPFR